MISRWYFCYGGAVYRNECTTGLPPPLPHYHLVGAFADHWLNGKCVPHCHDALWLVVAVMQNGGVGVKDGPNAVPAELLCGGGGDKNGVEAD